MFHEFYYSFQNQFYLESDSNESLFVVFTNSCHNKGDDHNAH